MSESRQIASTVFARLNIRRPFPQARIMQEEKTFSQLGRNNHRGAGRSVNHKDS
jgi:hypothetical protein